MNVSSSANPPIDLLPGFDTQLQAFYWNVLFKFKINKEFKKALSAYHIKQTTTTKSTLNYDLLSDRIAYIFRYGPFYTSAVANHLLKLLNNNPTIFHECFRSRCINICCLGGGSASEVVAISKILTLCEDKFWIETQRTLHMKVTIVDMNQHWEETAQHVIQKLEKSTNFFNEKRMDISFRFIQADLLQPLSNDVRKALKEADVVTMVKFFSVLKQEQKIGRLIRKIQYICIKLKKNALLFHLDTGVNRQLQLLQNSLRTMKEDIECIYGPVNLEVYTLSLDSLRKCVELFWEKFQKNLCLTSAIVNVCAWSKTGPTKFQNSTVIAHHLPIRSSEPQTEQVWEEQVILSKENLLKFHQQVHYICHKNKKDSKNVKNLPDKLFSTKSKSRRLSFDD